jgi:uncharacterized protein
MQVVTGVMVAFRRCVLALILCAIASPVWADFQTGYDASQRGDYATAHREWRPLAEQGDAHAQFNLGIIYDNGQGVPQDYAEAVKWYRKAADQGNARAQLLLGTMYRKGQGVPQDYAEAVKWHRLAADQGHAIAQFNLGIMYRKGQGVPQDYAEAVKWYRLAADQGYAAAQNSLGIMYKKGQGVPQNYAKAVNWCRKAAEQGYARAQNNLGFLYEKGQGVPQDYIEAVKWYRKAADQGQVNAQFNFGTMYVNGIGVPKDYQEAYFWFSLSAAQGNEDAQKGRDLVARSLSLVQKVRVQQRASQWRANTTSPTATVQKKPSSPSQKTSIREVQTRLAKLGYTPGPSDGVMGRKTRNAIEAFQRDEGLPATGKATKMLGELLETKLASRQERTRPTSPPPAAPLQVGDFGTFHTLVIGNDAYRFLPQLRTAVKDAKAVAELLEGRYGFRATTLINATRDEVIQALEKLRRGLTEQDNLLIYYAGHGQLDRAADRGYWLPIDATEDSQANWLNNVTITDTLKAIRAKHVMVVADSCYSGTLTRDTRGIEVKPKEPDYVAKTHRKKSRTVLASGGLEPVSDSGGSGHSVFAKAFMDALRDNEGVIDGLDVFSYVRKQVRLNADQVPHYGNIRYAGHEVGGDFLFARKLEHQSEVRREEPAVAAIQPAPVPQPSSPVRRAVGVFPKTYRPGDTFKDCALCPEMVVIPPGTFRMGSPSSEPERDDDEGPQHKVWINYSFAVGKYEVTQAEWRAVMGTDPSFFTEDKYPEVWANKYPVEQVSWSDAQDFVHTLSVITGEEYRLLSEAEWEYVARAGTTTPFQTGQTISLDQANFVRAKIFPYDDRSPHRPSLVMPAAVGSYPANGFGLHDVHGNVWEWVTDCWHDNYDNAPKNGEPWTTGADCSERIVRGGSFITNETVIRSANRFSDRKSSNHIGFRVARSLSR